MVPLFRGPSEAFVLANVGDSRTYLLRHGRLRRVTIDHSYVQELVSTGHISEDEARTHPRRNIITRALGIEPDVKVDWWTLPLIRGDRFLLCSDGLVDEVDDATSCDLSTTISDPQEGIGLADRPGQRGRRTRQHDRGHRSTCSKATIHLTRRRRSTSRQPGRKIPISPPKTSHKWRVQISQRQTATRIPTPP